MNPIRAIENRTVRIREQYKLPVFHFLLSGAFAAWQSFFNVHLDAVGFSSMQIGALNAIFISTSAMVVPFWGMFADRYGNNRVLLLLTAVCALVVLLIGRTLAFPWMLVLIAFISVFHQPSGAVVDGMSMGFVRGNPRFAFGQFRLWSSAGYATLSLVVGYLARQGTGIIFHVSSGMFLLLVLFNLSTLPATPVTGRSLVTFRSFGVFFRNRSLLIFLLIILFFGITVAPLMQFINLYYKDIGAEASLIGWVFFVQAIPEIPAFLIGTRLVKRIGAERMILLSMTVSMLRMLLYGLISDPRVAIFFSIFHCITIAFFLLGVVEYVHDRTPDHLRTTGQALIWAFHYGAGMTLGYLFLGYLRDATGMLKAMQIHAGLALLILVLAALFFRRTGKERPVA
jgi:PPP family 3-phenylpropionic acid transporter